MSYPPPDGKYLLRDANTSSVEPSMVDVVYMWCDDSDPKFREERLKRKQELNIYIDNDELTGRIRFQSHDELRFSLRSVNKYLPWVRNIYIITNKQAPSWLKLNSKISIIDHKEIIPHELLPTYNSVNIGTYVTKINGLADKFLLFNDDVFVNRPLGINNFFKKALPIVWLGRRPKNIPHYPTEKRFSQEQDLWIKTLLRAWATFSKKNNLQTQFLMPAHSIVAYTKNTFDSCLKKYPEFIRANSSPFRTGDEISRHLFAYELIHTYHSPTIKETGNTLCDRLLQKLGFTNKICICENSLPKAIRNIRRSNPMTFCLNRIDDSEEELFLSFIENKFPEKAPWEL